MTIEKTHSVALWDSDFQQYAVLNAHSHPDANGHEWLCTKPGCNGHHSPNRKWRALATEYLPVIVGLALGVPIGVTLALIWIGVRH